MWLPSSCCFGQEWCGRVRSSSWYAECDMELACFLLVAVQGERHGVACLLLVVVKRTWCLECRLLPGLPSYCEASGAVAVLGELWTPVMDVSVTM